MHFKTTESIREEMVGKKYESQTGQVVICLNVVRAGGGHQVHFNYGAEHNVFCALGRFRKRYPFQVEKD